MLVHRRHTDAKHMSCFLIRHVLVVVQLKHTSVLLCQVLVDGLSELSQQFLALLTLSLFRFPLQLFLHPLLELSLPQDVQTLVARCHQEVTPDALTLGFVCHICVNT